MANKPASPIARMIQHLTEDHWAKTLPDDELLRRFTSGQDEAAYGALLRRHGSMVLDVCRNVAGNEADAEDAFQATFLVLARKAKSIRKMTSVASWLHGVAYRTALQGRRECARRRKHESRAQRATGAAPGDDLSWHEVQQTIHAELAALSERYRAPLVLCFLEGATQDEAAKQLGIAKATLKNRLERGRALLRVRLMRQGLGSAAILTASAWPAAKASACVRPTLAACTVKAVLALAGGQTTAGLVSAKVSYLAANAVKVALATKLTIGAAVVLGLALVPTVGNWAIQSQSVRKVAGLEAQFQLVNAETQARKLAKKSAVHAPQPDTSKKTAIPQERSRAEPGQEDAGNSTTFRGRVLDPDGKPFPAAKMHLVAHSWTGPDRIHVEANCDAGGEFRISFAGAESGDVSPGRWSRAAVLATAEGFGPAVCVPAVSAPTNDLTLRLAKDDVPIRGRVIDLEGKPIAGVIVRVDGLSIPNSGDLTAWLQALENNKQDAYPIEGRFLESVSLPLTGRLFPDSVTDQDGRFQIQGVGRERVANLILEGPTIVYTRVSVRTREGQPIYARMFGRSKDSGTLTYYGATFDHVAAPSRPIVGVVRDKDTGKPIPGVAVESYEFAGTNIIGESSVRTVTDQDGRYRLVGMPKGAGNIILAAPGSGQPFFRSQHQVEDATGLGPATADFTLKRGILLKGRVLDKATSKPVFAYVEYFLFEDNARSQDVPGFTVEHRLETGADGSFQVVVFPGRGLLTARGWNDHYRMGVGADQIKEWTEDRMFLRTAPSMCRPDDFHTLVEINPPDGATSAKCDIQLDPGRMPRGTVVGPDGKPLTGTLALGLTAYHKSRNWSRAPLKDAEFTVYGLDDTDKRQVVFLHEGKRLAGAAIVLGDAKDPVTVKVEPWGSVTGRLVNAEGTPAPGVLLQIADRLLPGNSFQRFQSDQEGRYKIEGLAPGVAYTLEAVRDGVVLDRVFKDLTIKAGESKDLGDVTIKTLKKQSATSKGEGDATVRSDLHKTQPLFGRVLDMASKPAAGAKLFLLGADEHPRELGTSTADGQFQVSVALPNARQWHYLVARMEGAGVDFIRVPESIPSQPIELRLVRDRAIRGRIVNTEGKPLAGVKVSVVKIDAYLDNTLDSFLEEWKKLNSMRSYVGHLPFGVKYTADESELFLYRFTDADGRFTLAGTGAERFVQLRVRGNGIAEAKVLVVNRDAFDPKPFNQATSDNVAALQGFSTKWLLNGPEFTFVAEPERLIRGVVTDKATGNALPGIQVRLARSPAEQMLPLLMTRTDAAGHYEIRGSRKAKSYVLQVDSDSATGHLASAVEAKDTPGYEPITADIRVNRGVILTGQLIDASTKKPLTGTAWVGVLADNPFVKNYPQYDSFAQDRAETNGGDGRFRLVTIPGPVVLMGGPEPDRDNMGAKYKPVASDPRYPKYFGSERDMSWYIGPRGAQFPLQGNSCKVIEIEPGAEVVTHDILVEQATALLVKIKDGDANPLAGTWVTGIGERWPYPIQIKLDSCSAYHLQPSNPRLMVFYEPTKKLIGSLALKGDEKEPTIATLGQPGSLKGRLIGENAKPLVGIVVNLHFRERNAEAIHDHIHRANFIATDFDGTFQMEEIIPGQSFSVRFSSGAQSFVPLAATGDRSVQAGATLDLGDVRVKRKTEQGN